MVHNKVGIRQKKAALKEESPFSDRMVIKMEANPLCNEAGNRSQESRWLLRLINISQSMLNAL
jgi:hypothetical protein